MVKQPYKIQNAMDNTIVFAATTNPDICYIHEAMKGSDHNKFIEVMGVELMEHKKRGNAIPIKKTEVLKGTKFILVHVL